MKKKVLFFAHQANRSGAARVLINILKYLDRREFEPSVVSFGWGEAIEEFRALAPTYTYRHWKLAGPGLMTRNIRRLERRFRKTWLLNLCQSIEPEVLYYNTIANNDYVQWSSLLRTPKVMHMHEMGFLAMTATSPQWLLGLPDIVDEFIGCSEAVSNFFALWSGAPRSRVRTVYSSLDVRGLLSQPIRSREEVRRSLGLPDDCVAIGGAGIPHYIKGIDLFLETAAKLIQSPSTSNFRFVWVGANAAHPLVARSMGRLAAELQIADRVKFVSPTADALSYISALDMFVVSSREDSFPLVMLEAMLMGVPVIGYRVGGVAEALEQGAGWLVDRISSQSMAQKIGQLLNDLDTFRSMKTTGPQLVRDKFDMEKNVKQIESLLHDLA